MLSCKRANTSITPGNPSLNQLFSALRSTPQTFSVTAGRDTIIYGANGTMLHFYVNSFKDDSGNTITSGIINIQLVEIYKIGDFIANRTSTITNDSFLTSGGEINIAAQANGQTVFANKYGLGFKQSAASSQQMQLYYGNNNNTDSITTWIQGNNTTPGTTASGTYIDSSRGNHDYNYFFDSCTSFSTVNCDYFWNSSSQLTDIKVVVPNTNYNNSNTEISLVFPMQKVSIPVALYNSATNSFSLAYHGNQIPVGLNYELVVITNNNENWYYYEQSGLTTSGMTINAAMASETKNDIISRLQGL